MSRSLFNLRSNAIRLHELNSVVSWYVGCILDSYGAFRVFLSFNEITLDVCYTQLRAAAFVCCKHSAIRANTLVDLVAYDRPEYLARFSVIYVLFSVDFQTRIRLRTQTDTYVPLNSLCSLFDNANWAEREVMDMFGVRFYGHPDMRRLLCDYGFWGYPGRRDFPATGLLDFVFMPSESRVSRIKGTLGGVTNLCLLETKN